MGYIGTLGNKVFRLSSRIVLKYFTDDALTILAGSLFQKRDSPIAKRVLVTAETTSQLVELICVAA